MFKFPSNKINKVQDLIDGLGLDKTIRNHTLRRNIAYTFQYTDVVEWILEDTDLALTAREQVIKFGIIALNSIMEGTIRDFLERPTYKQPSNKVGRNIEKKKKKKPKPVPIHITKKLRKAHKKREKIHLHLCKDELEYKKYKKNDYDETLDTIIEFIEWIAKNV